MLIKKGDKVLVELIVEDVFDDDSFNAAPNGDSFNAINIFEEDILHHEPAISIVEGDIVKFKGEGHWRHFEVIAVKGQRLWISNGDDLELIANMNEVEEAGE